MKRSIIVLSASVILSVSANAQKDSWYVGGNVGFSSTQDKRESGGISTDQGKTTTWSFSPEIGTFLTDHVQVGVGLTVSGSKTDYQATSANTVAKSNYYGGTVYGRYFFGKEAFKPFVGVNIMVLPGTQKTESVGGNLKSDLFNFGANLNAGFGYAMSKRVTAVGSFGFLGYSFTSTKTENPDFKTTSSTFGLNANTLGNRFNIGFYYTL